MTSPALLAVTVQQKVALAVAVVIVLTWVAYLWSAARRTYEPGSELVAAPNRKPAMRDETLEGPRLERFLAWALALLAVSAIGLPAYWLREPFRQKAGGLNRGEKYFDKEAVERGKRAFQAAPGNPPSPREPHYACENCHGVKGIGGSTNYTLTDPAHPEAPPKTVKWDCPPLNTVMLRYRPEEVKFIITYGRAGTPMPPWGVAGGGALSDQQIDDLVAYLDSIKLKPKQAQAQAADLGTDGGKLFDNYCARCHTQGYSYHEPGVPGGGAYGPNLTGGASTRQFATTELQMDWIANTAPLGQKYGARGVSSGRMPHFANMLTPEQIRAIADFERGL